MLAGEMLAAFVLAHLPRGAGRSRTGASRRLPSLLVFLFLAAAGAGPASIDARLGRETPVLRGPV